jgi:hypothetical protein
MNVEEFVKIYFDAWNETDAGKRMQLLSGIWADRTLYIDPTVKAEGAGALSENIDKVLAKFPGSKIFLASNIEEHHGQIRFNWKRVLPDGTMGRDGVDYCEIGGDGKFTRVIGFFGELTGL